MIGRMTGVICAATLWIVMSSHASAQMVRVGPFGGVNVRVPFVSVDVLPFGGGTRVRAPFTAVDTRLYALGYGGPGYGYYHPGPVYHPPIYPAPVYPVPVYPHVVYPDVVYHERVYPDRIYVEGSNVYPQRQPYQSTRLSMDGSLGEQLRDAAQRLAMSLSSRRDDADVWLDYLGPQRIIETIDQGESPERLSDLLINYQGVVGNPNLSSISRAPGFSLTLELLGPFVASGSVGRESPSSEPAADRDTQILPSSDVPARPTPAAPVRPAEEQELQAEQEAIPESIEELPAPKPTEI